MPIPPFPPTKPQLPPDEPVRRATESSPKGSTLDKPILPAAELRIHYLMQFRFVSFWRILTATPYWNGDTPAENLADVLAAAPDGWLEPDDRIVQHEKSDETTTSLARKPLTMIRVSSEKLSRASAGFIWVPCKGVLPAHLDAARRKAWKVPGALPNGPHWHQWGIRGTMELYLDPFGNNTHEASYKSVCVWERWKPADGKFTVGMCVLPPGTYAGFPRAMGNHNASEADMLKFPAIQVCAEWMTAEPAAADPAFASPDQPSGGLDRASFYKKPETVSWWEDGVRGWRVKNPASNKTTTAIFIHPGNQPNWFLGCQSPGPEDKQKEWGFEALSDTQSTMWEILDKVGISRQDYVKRGSYPKPKERKWFIIRVTTEENVLVSDGWKRKSIWL